MFCFTPGQKVALVVLLGCALFGGGLQLFLRGQQGPSVSDQTLFAPSPTPLGGQPEAFLRVHVAGAVRQPGVYVFGVDDRVIDAIDRAGGATDDAVVDDLNLAAKLRDGMRLYVPDADDGPADEILIVTENIYAREQPSRQPADGPGAEMPQVSDVGTVTSSARSGRKAMPSSPINLNTANLEQLQTLPGVGEAIARRILAYRETIGPFKTTEDIQKVRGIGPATYQKMAPYLTTGQ